MSRISAHVNGFRAPVKSYPKQKQIKMFKKKVKLYLNRKLKNKPETQLTTKTSEFPESFSLSAVEETPEESQESRR